MQTFSFNKKTFTSIKPYFVAFVLPPVILGLFHIMYDAGFGTLLMGALSSSTYISCSLASLCTMFYFQKSLYVKDCSFKWSLFLSLFYALSSHGLLPINSLGIQLIFALFPLLVYSFELFLHQSKTLLLILLLSIFLSLDTFTASIAMIGLIFAFFFFSPSKKGHYIADFLHLLFLYALAICISGVFSLPAYKELFDMVNHSNYSGFSLALSIPELISRVFMGSVPLFLYSVPRNISLYSGLFFTLILILYFLNNKITLSQRLKNLGYMVILLFALEFSPLRFLFELCVENNSSYIYFEYIFIFWTLKLAAENLSQLEHFKISRLIIGIACFCALIITGYYGAFAYFHPIALISTVIFGVLYILILLFRRSKQARSLCNILLTLFLALELICNTFLVTNQNAFPALSSTSVSAESSATTSKNKTQQTPEAQYALFSQTHIDDTLFSTLNILTSQVELDKNDKKQYNSYGLLDAMEEVNARCHKIGADSDLFIPTDITIEFAEESNYKITSLNHNLYALSQYSVEGEESLLYIPYTVTAPANGTLLIYDSLAGSIVKFENYSANTKENGWFRANSDSEFVYNFQLSGYYMNEEVYAQIPDLLLNYTQAQISDDFSFTIYYAGIASTFIGLLLLVLIYFNKDRQPIIQRLNYIKNKLACHKLWDKLQQHFSENYIYYLSFSIPVLLYILTMILFDCIPFGTNSFYDEDGIASTLPSFLSSYNNISNGDINFSMNGGYGYSPYVSNYTLLVRTVLTIFPISYIPSLLLFLEGIFMGLTSLFLAYYLTHRMSGKPAYKKDCRVLIAACMYSLNTYMLAMHCFPTWYYVFFALPLLLLAMDYLMYLKKWQLYVLTLAFCIFTNIHLSIFVCFFLIIWFFTYNFKDFKDFWQKGCRFAFFSILAAGCNFFCLVETFTSKANSLYQVNDSVAPTFHFYTSFWKMWEHLFIFSPSQAISADEGYINLYMGILTLILLGIYLTSKRISLSDKLKKCIPIAILSISFNEQVLSYIWNGFHYQSNVPNRYTFLLLLLCALISYDALCELKHVTIRRFTIIALLLAGFLFLCHHFGLGETGTALICSLILIGIYILIHILFRKVRHFSNRTYEKVLCIIFVLELTANMLFTTSNYGLNSYSSIQNFDKITDFANEELKSSDEFYRISTPGNPQINSGMVYDLPTGTFFNSYVSSSQSTLHYLYGFLSGTNYNAYNYNSTPAGLALSMHKYILVSDVSTTLLTDITNYNYLGKFDNYFIFENPDILPFGYYVPFTFTQNVESVISPTFHNKLVASYLTDEKQNLYDIQTITYDDDATNAPNTYYFTDEKDCLLSFDEAQEIIEKHSGNQMPFATNTLTIHLNYTPNIDGSSYLYINEYIPLGTYGAKDNISTRISYPNSTYILEREYTCVTLNQETLHDFIDLASQNAMEDVTIDNGHITGTVNYEEAGFSLVSLPYDDGWSVYIDGVKADIYGLYGSLLLIPTPAGEHKVEMIFERTNLKLGIFGTIVFIVLACCIRIFGKKKKKEESL